MGPSSGFLCSSLYSFELDLLKSWTHLKNLVPAADRHARVVPTLCRERVSLRLSARGGHSAVDP